jgi:hypothetical protein
LREKLPVLLVEGLQFFFEGCAGSTKESSPSTSSGQAGGGENVGTQF